MDFVALREALSDAGVVTPSLVVDQGLLDANLDRVLGALPEGMGFRVVAKSLPSVPLLARVMERAQSNRLMCFDLRRLRPLVAAFPEADILMGKPLPVAGVQRLLETGLRGSGVRWLIDTPARLSQFAELARSLGQTLQVAFELDVGLHRGGLSSANLGEALDVLGRSPQLRLTGLMGYEPHLASIPSALGWRERARRQSLERYTRMLERCRPAAEDVLVCNIGGSLTFQMYQSVDVVNEIAVGSALVKPTDFDQPALSPFEPAAWICTPALKVIDGVLLPGLDFAGARPGTTVFTYGGKWMAEPVDPPGLSYNRIFGRSSNQEMLNGPAGLKLAPDELVFYRPNQSEAVMAEFGDLWVVDRGQIVERWPVLR